MSVYKPCDIRGPVSELSPELYRRWGVALGRRLESGSVFVVGGDVRETSPAFAAALMEGLAAQGVHVKDLGVVPTPMVYFAKWHYSARACAVVTASHNPPDINGLKWMLGDRPPTEADVATLERETQRESGLHEHRPVGSRKRVNVTRAYGNWLRSVVRDHPGLAGATVIVDSGNGCWSGRAVAFLKRIFPSTAFLAMHNRPDGTFPNRTPDCAQPRHLRRLSERVRRRGAALGIAFDGDGDRVAFVDHEGVCLTAEEAAYVLLQSMGSELEARSFVYDLKFSDRIGEAARLLGGTALPERSGHAFIRTRMIEADAVFGAEISGHYFYGALFGGDDGLYTACRMLRYMADRRLPLAVLRKECPPIHVTPDVRIRIPGREPQRMIEEIKNAFRDLPQTFVDGVRIEFPGGWALARGSVTESALTFRFEADSVARLHELVGRFCAGVPEFGDELLAQYEAVSV